MHFFLSNLYLFAWGIGKAALYTGLGPASFFIYAPRIVARALGWVPTRKLFGKMVSDGNSDERTVSASPSLRRAA